jgi:hypothetical protein
MSLFRYISICGLNHLTQCILEKSVSTERLTGGGEHIADVVIANFTDLGVPCAGQATDNASDVSVTCAKVPTGALEAKGCFC